MLSDRDLLQLMRAVPVVDPFDPAACEGATINVHLGPLLRQYVSFEPIV